MLVGLCCLLYVITILDPTPPGWLMDYLETLQGALLYYELVKGPIKHLVVSDTSVGHISLPSVVFSVVQCQRRLLS